MSTIVAYQFNGWMNIYAYEFHEMLWDEHCHVRVLGDTNLLRYHNIVAKWTIKPKLNNHV